jgi:hypothetical protein
LTDCSRAQRYRSKQDDAEQHGEIHPQIANRDWLGWLKRSEGRQRGRVILMRVVAIILLVIAALVGALALLASIAFGREYGIQTFWEALAWGGLFALVPLVPGILLLGRSKKRGYDTHQDEGEVTLNL